MNDLKELLFVDYLFHGHEFRISTILESDSLLKIEIEDKQSGEEWHGEFSPSYIEELTRKTGNFKRFETFVAMLQTVLMENCDSLSVDLMTYSDLESLRQRKIGNSSLTFGSNRKAANRQNKRYLIMTYTTDFDKIHYPLPLNFQGRMDPVKLKEIIRNMRTENSNLRSGKLDYSEMEDLKRKIHDLQEENNELRHKLSLQRNLIDDPNESQDLRKELRAIKSVVQGLEEELSQERCKHQRLANRKSKDFQTVNEELEEVKASERNLKVRLRNLTNELAMFKRHKVQGSPQPPWTSKTDPIYSRPPRSNSIERIRASPRTAHSPRNYSKRFIDSSDHFSDASDSHRSVRSEPSKLRKSRSIERSPRFDPTAYVHQQLLKKQEIQDKRKRERHSRISNSSERGGFRSRDQSPASSVRSGGSRDSNRSTRRNQFPTVYSNHQDRHHTPQRQPTRGMKMRGAMPSSDDEWVEEEIQRRRKETFASAESDGREINGVFRRPTPLNEPPNSLERPLSRESNRHRRHHANSSQHGYSTVSKVKPLNDAYVNESDEIGEIDRRLNVLQDFFQKYLHVS